MPTFTYAQLEYIWNQANGNAQYAGMAAAVAMAESGGNSEAISSTNDYGLWQFNQQYHGSCATLDVMTNARCAVQNSNNGTDWRQWCTTWSGGCCGCGTYMGSGAAYQKYLQNVPPDPSAPINATQAAANTGNPSTGQPAVTASSNCTWYDPLSWEGCIQGGAADIWRGFKSSILNPLLQIIAGIFGVAGGTAMVGFGLWEIVQQTQTGQQTKAGAERAGQTAVGLMAPETRAVTAYESGGMRTQVTSTRRPARRIGSMRVPGSQPRVETSIQRDRVSDQLDNEARDVAGGRRRTPSGTVNRDRARRAASRSRGTGRGSGGTPGGGGVG